MSSFSLHFTSLHVFVSKHPPYFAIRVVVFAGMFFCLLLLDWLLPAKLKRRRQTKERRKRGLRLRDVLTQFYTAWSERLEVPKLPRTNPLINQYTTIFLYACANIYSIVMAAQDVAARCRADALGSQASSTSTSTGASTAASTTTCCSTPACTEWSTCSAPTPSERTCTAQD